MMEDGEPPDKMEDGEPPDKKPRLNTKQYQLTLIPAVQQMKIGNNRADIIENLDTSGIFLNILKCQEVITTEMHGKLLVINQTDVERNTLLLDYIIKCSQSTLQRFIHVLEEQNQPHIATLFKLTDGEAERYIEGSHPTGCEMAVNIMDRSIQLNSKYGSTQLLTEAQREQIEKNRPNIITYLHIEETLLSKLQAEHIITSDMASQIRCLPVDTQKNAMFLEFILKFSQEKLDTFIKILAYQNQPHVAELFSYNQGLDKEGSNTTERGSVQVVVGSHHLALPYLSLESEAGPMLRSSHEKGQLDVYAKCTQIVQKTDASVNRTRTQLQEQINIKLLYLMKESLDDCITAKSSEEKEKHRKTFQFFHQSMIEVKSISEGSIVWALLFKSGISLAIFWSVYKTGLLREMFQQDFITEQLLTELQVESVELDLSIKPDEFESCKEEMHDYSFMFDKEFVRPNIDYKVDLLNQWLATSTNKAKEGDIPTDHLSVASGTSGFVTNVGSSDDGDYTRIHSTGKDWTKTKWDPSVALITKKISMLGHSFKISNFILDGLKAESRRLELEIREVSYMQQHGQFSSKLEHQTKKKKLDDSTNLQLDVKPVEERDDDAEIEVPFIIDPPVSEESTFWRLECQCHYKSMFSLNYTVINKQGFRLYSGNMPDSISTIAEGVHEELYGPTYLEQVCLPEPEPLMLNRVQLQRTRQILAAFERGICFEIQDGDIYARRLCPAVIFFKSNVTSYTVEELDRYIPDTKGTKIFDFNGKFRDELVHFYRTKNPNDLPSVDVYLSIGDRPGRDEINEEVLIRCKIVHLRAKYYTSEVFSLTS